MTTTDKTRQKLMDSMRKTKAASTPAAPVKKKRATIKRTTTKTKPATATPERTPAGSRDDRREFVKDPYQGGRRVWPD